MGGGASRLKSDSYSHKVDHVVPILNPIEADDGKPHHKRRGTLGRDPHSNVVVHSQLSKSFSVDPAAASNIPLGMCTDEELLAEVARRQLDIQKKITESLVREHYEFLNQIGKGASGLVTRVKNRQTGQEFACKTVHKDKQMNDLESMMTEIDIMKRVRHRHIVCMYELYETPRSLWIILELVTGGTLHNYLMTVNNYTEAMCAKHLHQMLQGIHYLHSLGIIHRDLKVENVLLQKVGDTLECKIADFGLSAILAIGENGYDAHHSVKRKHFNLCTELWGTKEYFAPELIDRAYGPQVDMWSLGCIAFEMLSGEPTFPLKNFRNERMLYDAIKRGAYNMDTAVWAEVSTNAKDFVKGLLTVKPSRRLCATEALQHKWMKTVLGEEAAELNRALSGFKENYTKNFESERKLKKVGSRYHLDVTSTSDCDGDTKENK